MNPQDIFALHNKPHLFQLERQAIKNAIEVYHVISFVLQSNMKHSVGIIFGALLLNLCYGLPTGICILILQRKKSSLKKGQKYYILCVRFIEYVFVRSNTSVVACKYVTLNDVKS